MFQTRSFLIACFLVLDGVPLSRAQDQLPRDSDKLIARAQQFWQLIAAGNKSAALNFIVSAKRDAFLTGEPLPVLEAKVSGVDLANSKERGVVRVTVKVLVPGATPTTWTITDRWVWEKNNWYEDASTRSELWSTLNGTMP